MSTINGKDLKTIFKELAMPLPKEKIKIRDFDNKPYVEVETLIERLNEVVGVANYSDEYKIEMLQALDTFCITATCTLSIFDDEGRLVCKKSMVGGSTLTFPYADKEKTTKLTEINSIPNDTTSACQDAFKKVCTKRLGIASAQLKAAGKGTAYEFTVTSPVKVFENGNVFINGQLGSEKYSLFSFKREAQPHMDTFKELAIGQVISVYATEKTDKNGNPQLTFKGFAETPTVTPKATVTAPTPKTETPKTDTSKSAPVGKKAEPEVLPYKVITKGDLQPLSQPGSFKIPSSLNNEDCEVIIQADMVSQMQKLGCWKPLEKSASKGIELNFAGRLYASGTKKQLLLVSLAA